MPNFVAIDDAQHEDIQCCVCLQPWDYPTELQPCKHILCTACVRTLEKCPDCRAPIKSKEEPSRILRNMALRVRVKCDVCSWEGSREASRTHECGSALLETLTVSPKVGDAAPQPNGPVILFGREESDVEEELPREPAQAEAAAGPRPQPAAARSSPIQPAAVAHGPAYSVPRPGNVQRDTRPWETYQLSRDEYDVIVATFVKYDDSPGSAELGQLTKWLHIPFNTKDIEEFVRSQNTGRRTNGKISIDAYCMWLLPRRRDPFLLYNTSPASYRAVLTRFRSYDTRTEGKLTNEACLQMLLDEKLAADGQSAEELLVKMETDGGRRDRRDFVDFDDLMNLFFVGYDNESRQRQASAVAAAQNANSARRPPRTQARQHREDGGRQAKQSTPCCSIA